MLVVTNVIENAILNFILIMSLRDQNSYHESTCVCDTALIRSSKHHKHTSRTRTQPQHSNTRMAQCLWTGVSWTMSLRRVHQAWPSDLAPPSGVYAVVGLSTPRGLVHPRPHTADPPPSPPTSGTGDVTHVTVGRACATRTTCCRLGANVAFSSRSKLDERDARLAVCIQHRRIYVCWPHDSVTVFGSQKHRHHMCTPLKATFHYAIKVVGLVCDQVCDLNSVMESG